MRIRKGILAALLSVVLALVCLVPAFAAEAKTFEQTMEVTQNFSGSPSRTTYTYRLYPNIAGSPLPKGEGNKGEYYEFTLTGKATKSSPITFTVDGPTNYQYKLVRVEAVPKGDTVTPEDHHFGYLFEVNADTGELGIIPYTCYDDQFKIWDQVDADGNPVGITLSNWIRGPAGGKEGQNGKDGTNGKNSTNGNNASRQNYSSGNSSRFAKYVNTEDGSRILFWLTVLLFASISLLILFFFKRRRDKAEEEYEN